MKTQKILLLGVTTKASRNVLTEAMMRGHHVEVGELKSRRVISSHVKGHDIVILTYPLNEKPEEHYNSVVSLLNVVKNSSIKHLIILGYPGNNEIKSTVWLPGNLRVWKEIAEIQEHVLRTLQYEQEVKWSYVHYPEDSSKIEKNDSPFIGDTLLIKSAEKEQWIYVDECTESILNLAENINFQESILEKTDI
jgi:putative NADH-flavin reductase